MVQREHGKVSSYVSSSLAVPIIYLGGRNMKINKDKKQKKLETVYLAPNFRPFLALTITEDTDIEDEFAMKSEDTSQIKTVQQSIKADPETHTAVFITEIKYEQQIDVMRAMREESTITYVLPIGTILVWEEGTGYIVAEEGFQKLEEIEESIKCLKE